MEPWDALGIEPTNDIQAIKKAYAVKLKTARPDDDAAAYQALREAYEAAQWWARHGLVTQLDASPVAPTPPAPVLVTESTTVQPEGQVPHAEHRSGEEALAPEFQAPTEGLPTSESLVDTPQPGLLASHEPSVEQLVQACATQLEQDGEAQFVRMWPQWQRQLEDLPIALHQEASQRFAVFVLQQDVPVEVLISLTRHFQWGLDYRVDAQLGQELSMALHTKLQQAFVFAALNKQPEAEDAWTLTLARLVDQGRAPWMRVLAVCMDYSTRQRVTQTSPLLLRALGASKEASQAVWAAAALGGMWQALLIFVLFIVAAQGVFTLSGSSSSEWRFTGVWVVWLLGIHYYLYRAFANLDPLWPSLRQWLSSRDWKLIGRPLVPFSVVLALAQSKGIMSIDFFGVLVALSVACFCTWLVVPTDERAWRKLFLPTFVLLWVGLAALFPELPNVALLGLSFGWVLTAHLVLSRFSHWFEAAYQGFVKLGFLRERPVLIFGIKFIGAAWLLYVLACLPVFLFRLCAQRGLLYAQVALVGGVLLSGAFRPAASALWLLACTTVAVFAIQCAQWGLQKLADFGLRKLAV